MGNKNQDAAEQLSTEEALPVVVQEDLEEGIPSLEGQTGLERLLQEAEAQPDRPLGECQGLSDITPAEWGAKFEALAQSGPMPIELVGDGTVIVSAFPAPARSPRMSGAELRDQLKEQRRRGGDDEVILQQGEAILQQMKADAPPRSPELEAILSSPQYRARVKAELANGPEARKAHYATLAEKRSLGVEPFLDYLREWVNG